CARDMGYTVYFDLW
nr:immunoglobulin heavy chain junction region [Macaca mulatta]